MNFDYTGSMRKFFEFGLLGLILAGLFAGCETTPPEPWAWTPQDSLDITALLDEDGGFLSSVDYLPASAVAVQIPPETLAVYKSDTTTTRYLVKDIRFTVSDSFFGYDLEPALDTTVTANVLDTLKGKVYLAVDSVLERGSDTFIASSDTLVKTLRYASWNAVFFDSTDTAWRRAKYSGGIQGTAPEVAFAPRIASVKLGYPGCEKTVFPGASADYYGISGLYESGELISLSPGEEVSIDEIAVTQGTMFLFVSKGSEWVPYTPGVKVRFDTEGKSRLYVIGISIESLLYSSTEWACLVWGIPVIVE